MAKRYYNDQMVIVVFPNGSWECTKLLATFVCDDGIAYAVPEISTKTPER